MFILDNFVFLLFSIYVAGAIAIIVIGFIVALKRIRFLPSSSSNLPYDYDYDYSAKSTRRIIPREKVSRDTKPERVKRLIWREGEPAYREEKGERHEE